MRMIGATLCGLATVLVLAVRPAGAMHATPAPTAAQLVARAKASDDTRRLLALSTRYREATRGERAAARAALSAAVRERRAALTALMESDPAGMLSVAIPEDVRRMLPPGLRNKVERDAEVTGTLEVFHVDHPTDSRYVYSLATETGRMALFAAGEPPADAVTGARVRVRGKRIARALAFDTTASSLQVLALPLANTLGAQKTAVLLVNFQDDTSQPFTRDAARTVVFGSVSDYDREASHQQTWLEGDVFGWYTIGLSKTTCDTGTLASQARSAATAAGVSLGAYHRFVYVFPRNACAWAGLGTVGGDPSHAWINGSFSMTVVAHEMGHNLGLYHSHALVCTDPSTPASCASSEYGDVLDVMGRAVSQHYAAFQKERLGWLGTTASPPITTVQASGSYVLGPYETTGTAPRALKILKSTDPTTGARTWYYVEARRPIGFDSSMTGDNLLNGVIVRTGSESSGNTSLLLDMTPETSSFYDPALVVGRTFTDATAGVSVTPTSVGTNGATVAVTLGSTACVRGALQASVAPAVQTTAAGGEASSAVTVTSGDSGACPATTVQLAPSVPSGWSAALATTSLTLAPGATATAALTLDVSATAQAGTYPIAVTASSGGAAATAGATVEVVRAMSVAVTTDRAVYPTSSYVFVTTVVTLGSAAVPGASLALTLTKPNGGTAERSLTTDANGAATVSFRLRRAQRGTYTVDVVATKAGTPTGAGRTTFSVQ